MRPESYPVSKKPTAAKRAIVFFLVPNFTMLPFSAAVETLRIANRMLGYEAYQWPPRTASRSIPPPASASKPRRR